MAPFLSRLFSIQKRFSINVRNEEQRNESKRVKPPEFDGSKQVRILLFRELNGQDRRLLFDSKSVRKRDPSASPGGGGDKPPLHLNHKRYQENSIEKSFKLNDNHSKEFVYEWQKSSPDEQMLREMIFGSVSISYQGTTFKVHTIRSPTQVMLSVVFAAPPVPMFRIGEQETEESGNWTTPTSEINIHKPLEKSDSHLAHSVPVNVPSRISGHHAESHDSDSDSLQSHDGYSSLPTTQHLSPETASACLPRSSSYNSLQRRLMRNKATSIELGLQKPDETSGGDDYVKGSGQKRVKLGLSIVINLNEDNKNDEKQFSHFLFTHMALIEGHLLNLKDMVVRAYLNRRCFVQLMFEGAKRFQKAITDLYTAPRLQNPEWLTIISSPNHRYLSYAFLEKFAQLLKQHDKKETNFFVSTLLTAVLTHHLSWVPSVIPTDSKIQPSQTSHKHTPCWVDLLAKSRPYNPHWVQLSDLYGALGSSLKLAKTVVKGQKKDVILKVLQVLSYFIRCSDICEQIYERMNSSDVDSFDTRAQNFSQKPSNEVNPRDKFVMKLITEPKCLNSPKTCIKPCCLPKQSLPDNLCSSHLKTLDANDTDSASDSSKDTCDVSITPTEEHISNSSAESIVPPVESQPVPIVSSDSDETAKARDSASSSLGYVSFKENTEPSKRLVEPERQEPTQGSFGDNLTSSSGMCVKNSNPSINIIACSEKCESLLAKEAQSKQCCACVSCPCYDNPLNACHFAKDLSFSAPKIKECESIEEGYHSMEEPHSPGRVRTHLSEMLKQYENWHPDGLEEVPLPELQHSKEVVSSPYKSFGWSLMAGVSNHYLMDFCLQGVNGPLCEDEVREDLIRSANTKVLGEPVSEAVCIVADTDKWSIQLLSSNFVGGDKSDSLSIRVVMSSLVSGMCEAILNMYELGIPPESCIIYLEDRLQELYFRSQMLSDFLRSNRSSIPLNKIYSTLNVDASDLPLLLSVATTHSPFLPVHNR